MAAATPRGPWLPILPDGDEAHGAASAASVERVLDELAEALAPAEETRAAARDPGAQALADGPAGQTLFFHYLDQARPGQGHDERALAHLETAIAATSETMTAPGLYGGFSGVAWVLEHLTGRLLEPPAPGEEDPGEEVAAALTDYLGHTPWLDEYDLISGLVGFGVWAVERAPRARGEEAAESVVRRLGELAERRDGGVTWRTPPERMMATEAASHPQGNFNLGVAHGVPGVIGVLGEMVAAGLPAGEAAGAAAGKGTARELLAGAVEWLLGQRLPAGSPSVFSYSVAPGVEPMPARLAWCYGDPGVSLALLGAARAAGEPEWERQAVAIARAAAERPPGGERCRGRRPLSRRRRPRPPLQPALPGHRRSPLQGGGAGLDRASHGPPPARPGDRRLAGLAPYRRDHQPQSRARLGRRPRLPDRRRGDRPRPARSGEPGRAGLGPLAARVGAAGSCALCGR